MIKPISPQELDEAMVLPDNIISQINELLKNGYRADGMEIYLELEYEWDKWQRPLFIAYQSAGWNVRHESSPKNESFFVFKRK